MKLEKENLIVKRSYKEVYKMDFTKKMALIKFAIATGREDEIGTYLQLAGYWDKDFTMIKDAEQKELVDRTDCLILYALSQPWLRL